MSRACFTFSSASEQEVHDMIGTPAISATIARPVASPSLASGA
jgi:hypothetical protein